MANSLKEDTVSKNLDHYELKKLQTQKQKLEIELSTLKSEQVKYAKMIKDTKFHLDGIKKRIESIKENRKIIISEHAILRYLERVYKLDIDKIKVEILSIDKSLIENLGGGTYSLDTHKIVIKDNVVVTVLESKQ